MKRLLRGNKSEKRQDDGPTPPGASKKSWASAAGLSALQQSRARSGSHPQIRHLAMENHEGPVTKATMEEIRREAGNSRSNLRINSLNFSAIESDTRPTGPVPAPEQQQRPALAPVIDSESAAARAQPGLADGAVMPQASSTTLSSELTDDSARAEFPLRTTSNVVLTALPPRVDTAGAIAPRETVLAAPAPGPEQPEYAAPPVATASDAPTHLRAAPLQSVPTPAGGEGNNKRVISERIKSLATRFSNSNLKDQPESPSTLYAAKRRPSNTPSVSERVSLFDQQEQLTNDPRLSGLFGKFGMASGRPEMHSRSPSVAGSVGRSSDARPSLEGIRNTNVLYEQSAPCLLKAPYTPGPMSKSSSQSSSGSSTRSNNGRAEFSAASASMPVLATDHPAGVYTSGTSNASTSHKSSGEVLSAVFAGTKTPSVPIGKDYGADSSGGEDAPSARRSSLEDQAAMDHQSTIAAGVQLDFARPQPGSGTQATNEGRPAESGYRGVHSDGPSKRRASIRSTFGTNEDGLFIITDPIDTTATHRPTLSPRATHGSADFHASRTSSAAPSPTSAQAPRTAPLRRAGAILTSPTGRPSSPAETQRSNSAADQPARARVATRGRSQSQLSPACAPKLISVYGEPRRTSTQLARTLAREAAPNDPASHISTSSTLLDCLSHRLLCDPDASTDGALSNTDVLDTIHSISDRECGDTDHGAPDRINAASMSLLVKDVISTADAGKVLPSAEYGRCLREAPVLKSRLQAARTRLSLEIRMRDTAKNLADHGKSSPTVVGMFKGKHSAQTHVDDYNQACSNVQLAEMEITELSAKLRVMEAALRDHQVAVLLSAVKTVVSEAASAKDVAHSSASLMQTRITELEQNAAANRSSWAHERADLISSHADAKQALEEQVRSLQNQTHDINARRISRETEEADAESPLARHSAGLAVERLTGELFVLKEQNQAMERQCKMLETRLDEALLKARGAQNELDELRQQAADMADASSANIEAARAEASSYQQCVQAFSASLKGMVGSLRLLDNVHAGAERLRKLNAGDTASASTPPTTPTLRSAFALPQDAISVDVLESLVAGDQGVKAPGSSIGDLKAWSAENVSSAMALLGSTIAGCSALYPEAMKACEAYSQLQSDLATEQRLREVQGLTITQQREKLSRATYLAESADQRVNEATSTLAAKHAKDQDQWTEERQRLFDNIERLTQDVKERQAVISTLENGRLGVGAVASAVAASASSEESNSRTAVGKIEPVFIGGQSTSSLISSASICLESRVSALELEIEAARQQLGAKTAECTQLRCELDDLAQLRQHNGEMGVTIEQLRHTEAALRKQLAELAPLKDAHLLLCREDELLRGRSACRASADRPDKALLGNGVQRPRNTSAMSTSVATTAVEGIHEGFARGETPTSLSPVRGSGVTVRGLARCQSLPLLLPSSLPAETRLATGYYSLTSGGPVSTTNAQTMTGSETGFAEASADVDQMLQAYSEKLMLKEDALRGREDELDAVCVVAFEIESALYQLLPSTPALSESGFSSMPRSPVGNSAQAGYAASQPGVSVSKSSLRNRSASFFNGLRASYLTTGDSPDLSPAALTIQTSMRPRTAISPQPSSRAPAGTLPHALGSPSSGLAGHPPIAGRLPGADGALLAVRGLESLAHMAAAETKRLRALICDLEDQSRETRLELLQTQGRLADLHNYCTQRSKQENAVQQDITHVLGQISGLRVKVVQLEGEKAASETEASTLRRRCRELEDATAERALKLIVERVGASDRAKVHTADSACALDSDATPADQPASESKPAKFAALGSMAISHPEAGEIRAEFNELLHQIIARRDEDIERIQALADGWRSDARKAMHASERKAWSMATRGIQTS